MAKIYLVEGQCSEYNDQNNYFVEGYIVLGAFKSLESAEKYKHLCIKEFIITVEYDHYEDSLQNFIPLFFGQSQNQEWLGKIGAISRDEIDHNWLTLRLDHYDILKKFNWPFRISEMEIQE